MCSGQGISPHVETHSAFKDGLLSLSLGSGQSAILPIHEGPTCAHMHAQDQIHARKMNARLVVSPDVQRV